MSALRKIRTLYKVAQFLFAVFLILLICTPYMYAAASATKPEDNPVRIAIPVSSVAADYNTASGYMNYTLEYLHAVTQYTDWTYEVITVPGSYEEGIAERIRNIKTAPSELIRLGREFFIPSYISAHPLGR